MQEKGGRRLGQELGVKIAGRSKREHCRRVDCFPCGSGSEGVCRMTGVGYGIDCEVCGQKTFNQMMLESKEENLNVVRGVAV